MAENDKIDFAALDPSRDGRRWEEMVASIAQRAARRRPRSIPGQLSAWARPALAAAAALALLVWTAAFVSGRAVDETDPTALLSQWAMTDEVPAPATIIEVLGGDDGWK
jgi:hypothetical protein